MTKGRIANIIETLGDLDDALRIRREEVLPVLERLGDAHSAAVEKWWIAYLLIRRGNASDRAEAEALFRTALDSLRRLGAASAQEVACQMREAGFDPG
jgi:hypothetical protein